MQIDQPQGVVRILAVLPLLLVMCASTQQESAPGRADDDCVLSEREYAFLAEFNERQHLFELRDSTWSAPILPDNLALIGARSSLATDYEAKDACPAPIDPSRLGATASDTGDQFSRVGFSADGDSALVQVWLGGDTISYVLVQEGERWTVAQTVTDMEVRFE